MGKATLFLLENGFAENRNPHPKCRVPESMPSISAYIVTKALLFLSMGPEIYRRQDAFRMPDAKWDEETLEEIESCYRQLADGKGFKSEYPIESVSVEGFYAAMSTLHFQVVSHAAFLIDGGEGMIDEMLFEHLVDKRQITLFNKADFLEDPFLSSL